MEVGRRRFTSVECVLLRIYQMCDSPRVPQIVFFIFVKIKRIGHAQYRNRPNPSGFEDCLERSDDSSALGRQQAEREGTTYAHNEDSGFPLEPRLWEGARRLVCLTIFKQWNIPVEKDL